jgi:hypothetical protein
MDEEFYKETGIGYGKLNSDGSFTPSFKDEIMKTGYFVKGQKVKVKEFFSEKTFTQEVLEKLNKKVKEKLAYSLGDVLDDGDEFDAIDDGEEEISAE